MIRLSPTAALLIAIASARTSPIVPQPSTSVWSGVYAPKQADRGRTAYATYCGRCHGDDPANSRYPLSGERFAEHWESRTLADLFRRIRDTMPPSEAFTVDDADKVDVMAYLLQKNGFPEGRDELIRDDDVLAAIAITRKTGPGPLRTGALVRVVGCLGRGTEREWQLTDATEPKRASLDSSSDPGRQAAAGGSGTRTIVLMNPFPDPVAHRGHRMAATGFLVRNADGDVINVVSLEMIAPSCSP